MENDIKTWLYDILNAIQEKDKIAYVWYQEKYSYLSFASSLLN
jgi:hypothetical protein